jgi:methyl-accepting chemotaxis protein
MERIVQSVDRVTGIMAGIRAASEEQLSGIEHVNAAIARMDQATRQNAAMVEQAAAAAAAMQHQAAGLAALVGVFKLDSAGGDPRTVKQALPIGMY